MPIPSSKRLVAVSRGTKIQLFFKPPIPKYRQYHRPIVSFPRFCCDALIAAEEADRHEEESSSYFGGIRVFGIRHCKCSSTAILGGGAAPPCCGHSGSPHTWGDPLNQT